MGLRPNVCYRQLERSNTRSASKVQAKDFLGGVPGVRTRQFVMGDQTKDYGYVVDLKASAPAQVRDNAIEALRQKLSRELSLKVGPTNWVMRIRQFPFHVLRENKAATGAGADRVSKGMKHAFGKNVGRAVQVRRNDVLLSIVVDEQYVNIVKAILDKARYKINLEYQVEVSKHLNKVLSGRKKWTRETKVEKVEEVKAKTASPEAKPAAGAKGAPATDAKSAGKDAKASAKPADAKKK